MSAPPELEREVGEPRLGGAHLGRVVLGQDSDAHSEATSSLPRAEVVACPGTKLIRGDERSCETATISIFLAESRVCRIPRDSRKMVNVLLFPCASVIDCLELRREIE